VEVIVGSERLPAPGDTRGDVVTVGTFDGMHVGHRAIMETVVQRARARGTRAVVYTFDPHPRKVLQGEAAPGLLTTLEQKLDLMRAAGLDRMVIEPFDAEFARTPPDRFAREILGARLRPAEVYVGYNFRFGHDREGSMGTLSELGPQLGFEVTIVAEVTVAGEPVSSTRIRELLAGGEVERAALLLGRSYAIRGRVARGDERGRTLGFPTANLDTPNEVLPEPGVYAGRVRFLDDGEPRQGEVLPAVTNLGRRPTFDRGDRIVPEAHLLDFHGDVYGREIEVGFEARLRAEIRFPGVEALRAQIARDVDEARRRLGSA
jgi:riboflavin kinase/FMN adenylyltransferase